MYLCSFHYHQVVFILFSCYFDYMCLYVQQAPQARRKWIGGSAMLWVKSLPTAPGKVPVWRSITEVLHPRYFSFSLCMIDTCIKTMLIYSYSVIKVPQVGFMRAVLVVHIPLNFTHLRSKKNKYRKVYRNVFVGDLYIE